VLAVPLRGNHRRRRWIAGRLGRILDRLAKELGFKLLRQANAGKGAALRNASSAVTGDLVIIQMRI
jgi:hypothetical protein